MRGWLAGARPGWGGWEGWLLGRCLCGCRCADMVGGAAGSHAVIGWPSKDWWLYT
jgi:heme A synthase